MKWEFSDTYSHADENICGESQCTAQQLFDTSAIDSLNFSKIKRDLFPVLRSREFFDLKGKKTRAKKYLAELMNLTQKEKKYIPELLFDEEDVVERVRTYPMALWKCRT